MAVGRAGTSPHPFSVVSRVFEFRADRSVEALSVPVGYWMPRECPRVAAVRLDVQTGPVLVTPALRERLESILPSGGRVFISGCADFLINPVDGSTHTGTQLVVTAALAEPLDPGDLPRLATDLAYGIVQAGSLCSVDVFPAEGGGGSMLKKWQESCLIERHFGEENSQTVARVREGSLDEITGLIYSRYSGQVPDGEFCVPALEGL